MEMDNCDKLLGLLFNRFKFKHILFFPLNSSKANSLSIEDSRAVRIEIGLVVVGGQVELV